MERNKPRKLKKAIKNSIIIYDVSACPKGMSMDKMWEIFQNYGMIVYDSLQGDNPTLDNRVGKRVKIVPLNKAGV